jgi:hypothetical protein
VVPSSYERRQGGRRARQRARSAKFIGFEGSHTRGRQNPVAILAPTGVWVGESGRLERLPTRVERLNGSGEALSHRCDRAILVSPAALTRV